MELKSGLRNKVQMNIDHFGDIHLERMERIGD